MLLYVENVVSLHPIINPYNLAMYRKLHQFMSQKQKILQSVKSNLTTKTSLPQSQIETIVEQVAEENPGTPWWVIALKVIAYAIGIILAGYGTAAAATVYISGIM